jgi:hypothetical protein
VLTEDSPTSPKSPNIEYLNSEVDLKREGDIVSDHYDVEAKGPLFKIP